MPIDPGLIPGSGRSTRERNDNPLQYSCLENLTGRGAWQATVHGVARAGHNLVTKTAEMSRNSPEEKLSVGLTLEAEKMLLRVLQWNLSLVF